MIKRVFIIVIFIITIPSVSFATDRIINDQLDTLDLGTFIKEGEKYTKEIFPELNVKNLINSSIKGEIDNRSLYRPILKNIGKEIAHGISTIGSVLIIIIIHSILKSISENLGNDNTAQIAYFIEYLLIITIITNSFLNMLSNIKETIANLTNFVNLLVPILISLIIATGQVSSGTLIQPVLVFSVIFISNIINLLILPIITTSFILSIVSNISNRTQVGNLAKFFKSGVIWFLGFVITIFVGLLSLEGTLTSSVDGITIKGIKAATATFVPVVGKALGDSVETVLGATSIIKNSIGLVGIIIILRYMHKSDNKINNNMCYV